MNDFAMCTKCGLKIRLKQVGVTVVRTAYENSTPYTMHAGDRYECPGCGTEIVMYNSSAQYLTGPGREAEQRRRLLDHQIAGGEHVYVEFETVAQAAATKGYDLLRALRKIPPV